ncbi:hypothetical protein CC77DRAFT_559817 [Alternaria alternata]|uniref:Uncharacterized protein n=1 Tax=Alternaria alternata TaxID=5599 RepID=A0A177D581_ALTAL|nr:hypothetical protein CC77DRAFT_559817 [Alternaria alternata]OAG14561.1 hypothetical protein CC77DRAFT_559817 [Alternaria alternata]
MWLGDRWIPHNRASSKQPTLPSCAALCILVWTLDTHCLNMDTKQLLHYVRRSSSYLLRCRRRLKVNLTFKKSFPICETDVLGR